MKNFIVEESYKSLYEREREENILLKKENIKLHKQIEALTRMLDKLGKKVKA